MHTVRTMIVGHRGRAAVVLRAALVVGYGLLVCGCNTDQQFAGVPDAPTDVRMRHPITITEADHTLQIFIGTNRALLTAEQRADVLAFAQTWKSEATGGVVVDVPTGSNNERASADAMREIQSILAATGVPPGSIVTRPYQANPATFATIRITYPRVTAQAGPCGMWPKSIGPSADHEYFGNQPHWNFGCSNQHNLAAMIENPADLVQPRQETPAYTMRRTQVVDKYRQGQGTATQYPANNASKISDF
jgi:pilus assembly protein CpaD